LFCGTIAAATSRSAPINGHVRLPHIEPDFVCGACGKRGADIRPLFEPARNAHGLGIGEVVTAALKANFE
jgi:hypothetical protein